MLSISSSTGNRTSTGGRPNVTPEPGFTSSATGNRISTGGPPNVIPVAESTSSNFGNTNSTGGYPMTRPRVLVAASSGLGKMTSTPGAAIVSPVPPAPTSSRSGKMTFTAGRPTKYARGVEFAFTGPCPPATPTPSDQPSPSLSADNGLSPRAISFVFERPSLSSSSSGPPASTQKVQWNAFCIGLPATSRMPVVIVPRYNPNGRDAGNDNTAAFNVSRHEIVPVTGASSAVSSLLSAPAKVRLKVPPFSVLKSIGSLK